MSFLAKMPPRIRPAFINPVTPYLLPVLAVALAVQINWWVAPFLSFLPPFLTFLAAIMMTAWYGGFASAVFMIGLSALTISYYFVPPLHDLRLNPADASAIGFFVLEALAMAYCINYLRQNEKALRRANEDLAQEVGTKRQQLSDKEERLRGLMYELATLEERERRELAEELHDYLAQLLTLARMKMKQAGQQVYRSVSECARFIVETDELLQTSVGYVRTLMAELYPPKLHELGLPAALRWLGEQMPRHGLTVEVSTTGELPSMPEETVLLLYQSVRELLMNIVKHAGVSRACVSLDVHSKCLVIRVLDSGRGFEPSRMGPSTSGQRFGLASVKDRITTIGGTFTLDSRMGKGTTITLTVPVDTLSKLQVLRAAHAFSRDRIQATPVQGDCQQSLPL
jgi:signal transduction histidine kinase